MTKASKTVPEATIFRSLAAFWRNGRKEFVPLTSEEATAAQVFLSVLSALGLIESKGAKGITTYHLTDKGKSEFNRLRPKAGGVR